MTSSDNSSVFNSSRLIVKNLPKKASAIKLREMFAKYGEVTDCTLKFNPDGVFRRFAFIGFNKEEEAENAKVNLDKTFIGNYKIEVDVCLPLGDARKPRAWSKYAKDSSAYKKEQLKNEIQQQSMMRDRFAEEVREKMSKIKSAKEKFEDAAKAVASTSSERESLKQGLLDKAKGRFPRIFISGLPLKVKQSSILEFIYPVKCKSIVFARGSSESVALLTFMERFNTQPLLKRSGNFFGGFKLQIERVEKEIAQVQQLNPQQKDQLIENAEDRILETGRLFIRSLPSSTTEDMLREVFSKYGELSDINLPRMKDKTSKGFAIITYMFPENAVRAFAELDGKIFHGRMLYIVPGDEPKELSNEANIDGAPSEFKKNKAAILKKGAQCAHNWNVLFLGAAAVADSIAARFDTSKSDIFDPTSEASLAVRLALGETSIIRSTREFLIKNGVQLDEFSRPSGPRSKTVILVKNLPANTNIASLKEKFQPFGEMGRVLLPPDGGITALIEFKHADDAQRAFKTLAYARFGPTPLYLEWAPGNVFSTTAMQIGQQQLDKEIAQIETKKENNQEVDNDDDYEIKQEEMSTIFVKNLNFSTLDDSLRDKFENNSPGVVSATITRRRDKANLGKSMGFGFVHYSTHKKAQDAIKCLQGSILDGHKLELKLSHKVTKNNAPNDKSFIINKLPNDSMKILVRNIPFQATKKEVTELFSTFGELSTVRMPKKASDNKTHRGFAFVQFVSKQDAKRAFNALTHSTHLYGRRLVLEWADDCTTTIAMKRKQVAEEQQLLEGTGRRAAKAKRYLTQTIEQSANENKDVL